MAQMLRTDRQDRQTKYIPIIPSHFMEGDPNVKDKQTRQTDEVHSNFPSHFME